MQKGTWIKLIWWDHTSPLSGAMHNNCHKLSCITPLRRDVGPHKTSLAPSLFVEVSTKPEKSTVMLICARGKILCIFYDFSIGFGTVSTVWYSLFSISVYQPLWGRIPHRRGVLDTTLYDEVCQWLATGQWFSPPSSINKTDRHNITEILSKVALNSITLTHLCCYLYALPMHNCSVKGIP
jgi:hypothetical protein